MMISVAFALAVATSAEAMSSAFSDRSQDPPGTLVTGGSSFMRRGPKV